MKTGAGGTFSCTVTPNLYTTYTARWTTSTSGSVVAQVAPKVGLVPGGSGYMKAVDLVARLALAQARYLQRLSPFGQWVNIANLTLGELNGRLFQPIAYLPKGVVEDPRLPVDQPGGQRAARRPQRHADHRKEAVKPKCSPHLFAAGLSALDDTSTAEEEETR